MRTPEEKLPKITDLPHMAADRATDVALSEYAEFACVAVEAQYESILKGEAGVALI